jgi:hypothetical protein
MTDWTRIRDGVDPRLRGLPATYRQKLPHGWLVTINSGYGEGITFVPFAEDGTGWGKNDPTDLAGD